MSPREVEWGVLEFARLLPAMHPRAHLLVDTREHQGKCGEEGMPRGTAPREVW